MRTALRAILALVGLLGLGGGALLLWADSPLPNTEHAQQKTYAAPPASADRDTFTIMTYNLGHLAGANPKGDSPIPDGVLATHMDEAVALIRQADPDVIGFQDIDFGAARSGTVHQLDTIATRLGYTAAGQAIGWNDRYLPFSGPVVSGQALLSRFPLRRHVRRKLPSPRPFWKTWISPRSLVQVTAVDIGGWPLVVMNAHLRAPTPSGREAQARRVNEYYDRLAQHGFPVVLLGSFGSVMPSVLATPSTDNTMELLLQGTDLQPALSSESAQIMGTTAGTYPAPNATRKIDYIFYRPGFFTPVGSEIRCGGASPPSPHCAVAMSFLLPRPKDKLPEKRIPDDRLPSLERLLGDPERK